MDVVAPPVEHGAHSQLADVRERAVERRALRRDVADVRRLDAGAVDQARHLDADVRGQVRDQAGVAHVAVDHARLARLDRVDDQRGVLQLRSISSGVPASSSRFTRSYSSRPSSPRPHELADRDAEPLDLGVVAHVPGQVLGAVLARLGREVAEPRYMSTRTRRSSSGRASIARRAAGRGSRRVLEAQEERLVVDAGAEERDLLDRHADEPAIISMVPCTEWQSPTTFVSACPIDEPADHRHRVRVVQEPRVRAHLGHVVADAEHHRRGAQRADDAADAERVADRLAQRRGGRDLVVAHGRGVAADLDAVDRRSRRRRAPRGGRATPSPAASRRAPRRRGARAPRPSRGARSRCRAARSRLVRAPGSARMSPSRLRVNSTLPGADERDLGHQVPGVVGTEWLGEL